MTRYAVFTILDTIEAETPMSAAELAVLQRDLAGLEEAEEGWALYVVPVSRILGYRLALRPTGPVQPLQLQEPDE